MPLNCPSEILHFSTIRAIILITSVWPIRELVVTNTNSR